MNKQRLITDSLVISLSIIVFTIVSVILSDVLFDVNSIYTILIYLIAVVFYILYGWLIRRDFIKKEQDKGDKALNHIFLYFLPVLGLVLVLTLVVNLSALKNYLLLMRISSSLLELVQMSFFGIMIGIFLYSRIEKNLGSLVFSRIFLPLDNEIGLRSVIKQTEYTIRNSWKFGMIILGSMIAVSNFLVFIVYPIIPAASIADTLTFTLPNFQYQFQAELGYRQEFFKIYDIPSAAIVDWKLVQSLMCFALFGIVALLIFLPRKKIDEAIGKLIELDDKILFLSDHGFTDYDKAPIQTLPKVTSTGDELKGDHHPEAIAMAKNMPFKVSQPMDVSKGILKHFKINN